jgi:hypothetical protein
MTASRYDLLPPNATTLERDLSRASSSLQRVAPPVPIIRTAKRVDIPDSVIPWLIYEYGLGELLPYITNQRQLVADGVLWQRLRGTPESVRIALGWVDVVGFIEEPEGGTDRWAEYMLGLDAPTDNATIDNIIGVATISSPVRSRLNRIYAVYDYRRFVLDWHLLSEGAMLSDHSGTRPRPDWPQISYGDFRGVSIDASLQQLATAVVYEVPSKAVNLDRFLLSHGILDEEWHVLNHPGVITNTLGFSGQYAGQTWGAFSWIDVSWADVGVVVTCSITTSS